MESKHPSLFRRGTLSFSELLLVFVELYNQLNYLGTGGKRTSTAGSPRTILPI